VASLNATRIPTDAEISKLIEQLGAEQYVRREKAQEDLRRLGVEAFDALLDAQNHEDIEIALRARYLLRSMPIRWADDRDPPEIKNLMRNYEEGGRDERKNRMEQLASLSGSHGIPVLCRLMRFETDRVLSKQAALLVMNHAAPEGGAKRAELGRLIRDVVGSSRRPAAGWLTNYANTLDDPPATLVEWQRITQDEETILARFPDQTDRRIVRDLLRWLAELLLQLEHQDDAEAVIQRTISLLEDNRQELFDMIDWALERRAWFVLDAVASRFPDKFQQDALLAYRWAESQLRRGNQTLAEQTAHSAKQLDPDNHERHIETAKWLTDRLLYDWAEREYRLVISATEPEDESGFEARLYLSDLLFDLENDQESAEIMKAVVDAVDSDPKVLQNSVYSPDELRARMHYRFAMYFARIGDRQQQRERLTEAIGEYQYDVDVLIAMYRLPDADPEWKSGALERINAVAGKLSDAIKRYEEIVGNPSNQRIRSDLAMPLAQFQNQFAWLVSNTEGDYRSALRASQRSLELSPDNPAFLDTLGRCYYAVGDLDNAVKCQSRAVKLEPFTQAIQRQLDLFEKALADSKTQSREATPES